MRSENAAQVAFLPGLASDLTFSREGGGRLGNHLRPVPDICQDLMGIGKLELHRWAGPWSLVKILKKSGLCPGVQVLGRATSESLGSI